MGGSFESIGAVWGRSNGWPVRVSDGIICSMLLMILCTIVTSGRDYFLGEV
jgi:hypothetical protein